MAKSKTTAPPSLGGLLHYITGRNHQPMLRLYHSYGDSDRLLVMGHALMSRPPKPEVYRDGFMANAASMMHLFSVEPIPFAKVRIKVGSELQEIQAADDGYFAAEWKPTETYTETWQDAVAELVDYPGVMAKGKIYMPQEAPFAVISDIDDTFLVTHTSHILQRLYVILTRNARRRKPFAGVVEHYNALALGGTSTDKPNPFFYVSSSEWNLYDYLKEFCRWHKMPEGIFLLNQMKGLASFWNTGGNNHDGKFTRVVRILEEFPNQRYILMGDDSQRDPQIYASIVRNFPGRVVCVYIRHRVKAHLERTRKAEAEIKAAGVEVCYFTHSTTALAHSKAFGLVNKE